MRSTFILTRFGGPYYHVRILQIRESSIRLAHLFVHFSHGMDKRPSAIHHELCPCRRILIEARTCP